MIPLCGRGLRTALSFFIKYSLEIQSSFLVSHIFIFRLYCLKHKKKTFQISLVTSGIWRFLTFLPESFVLCDEIKQGRTLRCFLLDLRCESETLSCRQMRQRSDAINFMGLIFLLILWTHELHNAGNGTRHQSEEKPCTLLCFLPVNRSFEIPLYCSLCA